MGRPVKPASASGSKNSEPLAWLKRKMSGKGKEKEEKGGLLDDGASMMSGTTLGAESVAGGKSLGDEKDDGVVR